MQISDLMIWLALTVVNQNRQAFYQHKSAKGTVTTAIAFQRRYWAFLRKSYRG